MHTFFFSPHNRYCILHQISQSNKQNKHTIKQTNIINVDPTWNIFSASQISRVWTPPTPSAHSSHPPLWNPTWVTAVEHLWTLCCVSVALQRSILWCNRWSTVNWRRHWMTNNLHRQNVLSSETLSNFEYTRYLFYFYNNFKRKFENPFHLHL